MVDKSTKKKNIASLPGASSKNKKEISGHPSSKKKENKRGEVHYRVDLYSVEVAGVLTLHDWTTIVLPELGKSIEEMEAEARECIPQVTSETLRNENVVENRDANDSYVMERKYS